MGVKTPRLDPAMKIERYCKVCEVKVRLVVRENHQNGSQFLGCPNWPNCTYTERIPEELIMRALGQEELF
jgi:ssDNA-binding Zn-finger/Zn-ribbon topoisomerase 1